MGGAIVTHMQHGEPYHTQSIMLVVIWITGFLRYPQVLQSFLPTRKETQRASCELPVT